MRFGIFLSSSRLDWLHLFICPGFLIIRNFLILRYVKWEQFSRQMKEEKKNSLYFEVAASECELTPVVCTKNWWRPYLWPQQIYIDWMRLVCCVMLAIPMQFGWNRPECWAKKSVLNSVVWSSNAPKWWNISVLKLKSAHFDLCACVMLVHVW